MVLTLELKMNVDEKLIEHEVRLRVLEEVIKDIRYTLLHIDTKLDSQFKWTIGTIIGLFCGTFLPLFGGIMLHMAKLI